MAKFVLDKPNLVYLVENTFGDELVKASKLGFEVVRKEQAYPVSKYFDVGAFIYLAKIIEWEFTGFSVEKHFEKLLQLNELVEKEGYFESTEHRYLMVLRK